MKKVSLKFISVLIVALMILSGCGGADKNKSENTGDVQTIKLQMRQIESFNPLLVTHHSVRDAFSLCYEPLFTVGDKISPEGVLARNIELSDDCFTAVVTLKDSVVWHDGISFTSGDVVHTINMLKENPDWEYAECVKYIDSAEAIDPLSLRLRLTRPYGQIAFSLTFPIVAAHNFELDTKMTGTGPYAFEKYTPAMEMTFSKNGKWHGGEAICEKVSVSIIRDNAAATTAFNTGLIHAVTGATFDTANTVPKANTRTTLYPSAEYEYMGMNHRNTFFDSQTVRSAISSAIDRSLIVKECYLSCALPTNAPIHPSAQDVAESSILSQYSLSDASEMLFLEGYSLDESTNVLKDANGRKLSFTLLVNKENQSRVKTAELLTTQLFAAGIEVKTLLLSFDEYSERIRNGNYDAYLGGVRLQNLYDFEFLLSQSGDMNNYGYNGEYMELALSAICSASGEDALSDAVFNFEEVFLREQPLCGIAFRTETLLTNEAVMGKLLPTVNSPYRNIWRWSLR